ncbi:MAG: PAS domain-containing protein [Verrucomicrobia bacterium]|nr:PAS domain-containing protein [Verrucomicrobiota bacterium]MCH8512361.1 PAS domain-containing protein [Kiritimatiellia bacterium]
MFWQDPNEYTRHLDERIDQLQTLIDNLPGMVYRCENNAKYEAVYASSACLGLLGIDASKITPETPLYLGDWIHPEDVARVNEIVQRQTERNEPYTMEYRIIDQKGDVKDVWEKGRLVHRKQKAYLEGFIMDISERKALERLHLEVAEKELTLQKAHKTESLERMAAAVAHQCNNKLQAVLGLLELAEEDVRAILKDAQEPVAIKQAIQVTHEAAQIGRNMLSYLGITMTKTQTLELTTFLENGLPELTRTLPAGVRVETCLPNTPLWVRANEDDLRDILGHLLVNAAEACPDQPIRVILNKHQDATPLETNSPCACLLIHDEGPGIPEAHREDLFDPFFSTKFTGRGLGLSVARGLLHRHDGELDFHCEPNQGTDFRVWLPLTEGPEGR